MMKDDHQELSDARNHICDALKTLLKAEIMTAEADFRPAIKDLLDAVNLLVSLCVR